MNDFHRSLDVAAPQLDPDGSSIDFAMIDASHDYCSVRDDVSAWLPRVKPGGVIAGDGADWPEVLIAVHESIPLSEVTIINDGANWFHIKARPERGFWAARRDPGASPDFLVYIPCVNRPDLLERAVMSIRDLWDGLVVIDQTADGLSDHGQTWFDQIAGVFRASDRALSFTQMMNWAQAEARERGADYLAFMHNDAECLGDVALRVLDHVRSGPDIGVAFTNYDALAVFRVDAIADVGPWDETFRWYFSDNDYYRRMRLRGWHLADFGGQDVIHHTSQTLRGDHVLARDVSAQWAWHESHYAHKMGWAPRE